MLGKISVLKTLRIADSPNRPHGEKGTDVLDPDGRSVGRSVMLFCITQQLRAAHVSQVSNPWCLQFIGHWIRGQGPLGSCPSRQTGSQIQQKAAPEIHPFGLPDFLFTTRGERLGFYSNHLASALKNVPAAFGTS